jgi:hypothetical protein
LQYHCKPGPYHDEPYAPAAHNRRKRYLLSPVEIRDLPDLGPVIMAHVQAGPYSDFQDTAFRAALLAYWPLTAGQINQVRRDVTVRTSSRSLSVTSKRR